MKSYLFDIYWLIIWMKNDKDNILPEMQLQEWWYNDIMKCLWYILDMTEIYVRGYLFYHLSLSVGKLNCCFLYKIPFYLPFHYPLLVCGPFDSWSPFLLPLFLSSVWSGWLPGHSWACQKSGKISTKSELTLDGYKILHYMSPPPPKYLTLHIYAYTFLSCFSWILKL